MNVMILRTNLSPFSSELTEQGNVGFRNVLITALINLVVIGVTWHLCVFELFMLSALMLQRTIVLPYS